MLRPECPHSAKHARIGPSFDELLLLRIGEHTGPVEQNVRPHAVHHGLCESGRLSGMQNVQMALLCLFCLGAQSSRQL